MNDLKELKDLMLPGVDGEDARAKVSFEDIRKKQADLIQQSLVLADQLRDTVEIAGRKTSDQFWVANRQARELGSEDDQGRFGTRVRRRSPRTLSFEWYVNRFWNDSNKDASKKRIASKYIPKSYRYHHDMRQFMTAPEWERFAIQVAESRFKQLREINDILTVLVDVLLKVQRLQDKFAKTID